ncbi:MAG: phosphoribosyl-ATP diphosphatase [Candidatus Diapherotrites archaeon]|nr:phosphoribosyl-ATP diphosphatase [Candidatus Diapherotrites archaeon]
MKKKKAIAFTYLILPKNTGLKQDFAMLESVKSKFPKIKILRLRGEDIPKLVEEFNSKGIKAFGLTGNDLFQEYCCKKQVKTSIIESIEWNDESFLLKKPSLCLIGARPLEKGKVLRIALNSKFEGLSKAFLEKLSRDGFEYETECLNGGLETAVSEGLFDYCVEIVCTGKALKENALKIISVFFQSDWVLIGEREPESQLERLSQTVKERIKEGSAESYTAKIVRERKALKKLNEESFELCQAIIEGKKGKIIWEAADLLYFLTVCLAESQVDYAQVWNELKRRELEKTVLNEAGFEEKGKKLNKKAIQN